MKLCELRIFLAWCNNKPCGSVTNVEFWRRVWYGAQAYDQKTCILIRAMVAQFGTLPEETPANA